MFNKFLEGLKLSIAPSKVGDPANKVTDATSDKGEATSEKAPSSSGKNGTDIFAHVEPPLVYGVNHTLRTAKSLIKRRGSDTN